MSDINVYENRLAYMLSIFITGPHSMTVMNLEKRLVSTLPSLWAALPAEAQDSLQALLSTGATTGKARHVMRSYS
jgi:hypothetical protein